VLPALDSLAKTVRQKLGESLLSISQQSLPLPRATTSSLEALKTYADGKKLLANNNRGGIDLFRQAVAIDPDFAIAHADLGLYYYMGGDKAQGEEHFTKALSLLDRLTLREKLWIRAVVEDWRGNREQAANDYRTYLAQYPDDAGAWFRLGWTYMATLGQYEKAVEAFQKVLEIDSSDDSAYLNLASCFNLEGQTEKAIEYYQKSFQRHPSYLTDLFVNNEYGFMLVRMGNLSKAEETFRKMIAEDQDSNKARGYRSLALLDMYEGKYSAAFENFREVILLNKVIQSLQSEYRDHMFLASAYRIKGRNADFASELAAARRILSRAHFGPLWSMHLAKTYARMGKTGEATKLLNDMMAQARNPTAISGINNSTQTDQAAIYIVKGEIALATRKGSEAMESFELAQRVGPSDPGLESLAFSYRILGKPRESALKYEEIVAAFSLGTEKQEHWILAHYELAKIYRDLGDTQKAKEYYEQFLNIWKDADPDIPILVAAKTEYAKLK
jgi:eukaryotic-like serine/threonine-protein kinase